MKKIFLLTSLFWICNCLSMPSLSKKINGFFIKIACTKLQKLSANEIRELLCIGFDETPKNAWKVERNFLNTLHTLIKKLEKHSPNQNNSAPIHCSEINELRQSNAYLREYTKSLREHVEDSEHNCSCDKGLRNKKNELDSKNYSEY